MHALEVLRVSVVALVLVICASLSTAARARFPAVECSPYIVLVNTFNRAESKNNLLGGWEGGDETAGSAKRQDGRLVIRPLTMNYWWASVMSVSGCADLSLYNAVSFQVAGPKQGNFLVSLQTKTGHCLGSDSKFTPFSALVVPFLTKPLSSELQTVTIPFSALRNSAGATFNPRQMDTLNLESFRGANATYIIDDITIVSTTCTPTPTNVPIGPTAVPTQPSRPILRRSITWKPRTDLPPGVFPSSLVAPFGIGACGWHGMNAITFDDGPHPQFTEPILNALSSRGIFATFFILGSNVNGDTEQYLSRIINEGHQIASHTYSHFDLTTLTDAQIRDELLRNERVFRPFIGGKRPRFFRPPYGAIDRRVNRIVTEEFNYLVTLWNLDPADWEEKTPEDIVSYYKTELKEQSPKNFSFISLQHDIQRKTATAINQVLDYIVHKKGFSMVSMMECANEAAYQT